MWPDDDAIVAEIALKKGWVDGAKLRRALEIQAVAAAADLDEPLIDLLVSKGFITSRQLREFEDEIGLARLVLPAQAEAIEGYRLVSRVGRRGLGVVFQAVQVSMERTVALKVLPPDLGREQSFVERFLREARALGRVSHPNVVGGLAAGRSGDCRYVATELFEGRTLLEAFRSGPLAVPAALALAAQLAQALGHLDGLGLVHRDVCPRNVLLAADGLAKLTGLGEARLPSDPSVTQTGIPVGTPHYSSPELRTGALIIDARSDIYSLGATLYRALAGQAPADAGSSVPWVPPNRLRAELPGAVNDLVCRMMVAAPSDRIGSPVELEEAIEAVRSELARPLPRIAMRAGPAPSSLPATVAADSPAPKESEAASLMPTIAPPPPLEAEAPRRRRAAQAVWAGVFALLIVSLAASAYWAVRTRRHRATPPDGRPIAHGPGPKSPPPTTVPPEKAEPEAAPPDPLPGRLAAEALAFDAAHPGEHAEALLRLRRALMASNGSPPSAELAARLAAREQAFTGAATAAYNGLLDKLGPLCAQDRFGEALRAAAEFPTELRYGVWGERVDEELARLDAEAHARYLTLARDGGRFLAEQKFADALDRYRAIQKLGIPWIKEAGTALVTVAVDYAQAESQGIAEAERVRAVAQRREAIGKLRDSFAQVMDEAKAHNFAKALDLCVRIPMDLREGDPGKAVSRLEARLRILNSLWTAILDGPPAAIGMTIDLHGHESIIEGFDGEGQNRRLLARPKDNPRGPRLAQRIVALRGADLIRMAQWTTAKGDPATAAAQLGVFYLAEGQTEEAGKKLQEAQRLGADVADELTDLEAQAQIADALAACKAEKWAEARTLLDALFETHGTAPSVAASYKELSEAHAACLRGPGKPVKPPPAKPVAMPPELFRRVLLPETRLGPRPPADPLAAHFASPLERGSPVRRGLADWGDYAVALEWTPEQGSRFVLAARLSEAKGGQFAYYYVAVDGAAVTLGRRGRDGEEVLASGRAPKLSDRRRHRLTFYLVGPKLLAVTDGKQELKATDSRLAQGQIALSVPDAPILVHELSVTAASAVGEEGK